MEREMKKTVFVVVVIFIFVRAINLDSVDEL